MGAMINRRREIGKKEDGYTLIHDWEAEDWSNYVWIDRVGERWLNYTGNIARSDGYLRVNYQNYFYIDLNSWANFGDDFKITAAFMIPDLGGNKSVYIADFGSVTSARHAFGIGVTSNNRKINHNPKLSGNDSGVLYEIPNDEQFIMPSNTPITYTFGIKRINDTQNILFSEYQGVTKHGAGLISREDATFNRNFIANTFYIGRGVTADLAYVDPDFVFIKSIKIYKR